MFKCALFSFLVLAVLLPIIPVHAVDVVPINYVKEDWYGKIELASYTIQPDGSVLVTGYLTAKFTVSVDALYIQLFTPTWAYLGRVDLLGTPCSFVKDVQVPFSAIFVPAQGIDSSAISGRFMYVAHVRWGWLWFTYVGYNALGV